MRLLLDKGVALDVANKYQRKTAFQLAYEAGLMNICLEIQNHEERLASGGEQLLCEEVTTTIDDSRI